MSPGEESGSGVAEARLRSHAESVVEWASVPRDEHRDLVEELYSGLWERWHQEVAAGIQPEAAVERAIAAFGTPAALGGELTLAYHSRLYASTLGALLPPVIARRAHPVGLRRVSLLLLAMAGVLVAGAALAVMRLPPTRSAVATVTYLALAVLCLVAFRALLRGQRWALAFARLCVPVSIGAWVIGLLEHPIQVDVLGVVGLVALWPAFGSGLSGWVAASRSIGRALGVGVAGVLLAGVGVSVGLNVVPELTAATPSDLHLDLAVECTMTDGSVTGLVVTAGVVLDRMDVRPNGIRPTTRPLDRIALWIDGDPAPDAVLNETIRNGRHLFQPTLAANLPAIVDRTAGTGASAYALFEPEVAGSRLEAGAAVGPGMGPAIRVDRMQARHRYVMSWDSRPYAPAGIGTVRSVIVTYDHLDRFGSQAVAGCGSSAVGAGVPAPFLLP